MDLNNKVALITGASSGIGKAMPSASFAIAYNLNDAGMKLILTARSEDELNEIANNCKQAKVFAGSITESETPQQLLDFASQRVVPQHDLHTNKGFSRMLGVPPIQPRSGQSHASHDDGAKHRATDEGAIDSFGQLDVLVNNAGMMAVGAIEEIDIDKVCLMARLNVESVYRMAYTVLKHFKQTDSGFLINTSSVAGLKTSPKQAAYDGTKHAVEAFTDSLRMELANTKSK